MAWVEENEGLHVALRTEVASISERLNQRARDLDRLSDREKSLSATLGEREAQRASATGALSETQSELQRGRAILKGMEGWQAKTRRMGSIGEEEETRLLHKP